MAKHFRHGLCLLMAAALLLSCLGLPTSSLASEETISSNGSEEHSESAYAEPANKPSKHTSAETKNEPLKSGPPESADGPAKNSAAEPANGSMSDEAISAEASPHETPPTQPPDGEEVAGNEDAAAGESTLANKGPVTDEYSSASEGSTTDEGSSASGGSTTDENTSADKSSAANENTSTSENSAAGESSPANEGSAADGPKDLNLNEPQEVFRWIAEHLPGSLAELEAMPAEWWDSLLPGERLTAEGELLYRRFFQDGSLPHDSAALSPAMTADEPHTYAANDSAFLQTSWETVGNGRVNRKYLNGLVAFCFNQERHFPDGAAYSFKTASEAAIDGPLAYIIQAYGNSGEDNAQWWNQNQVSLWAIQAGADARAAAEAFARSYCRDRGISDPDTVNDYVQNIGAIVEGACGQSGIAYLYQPDNPANQELATFIAVWPEETPPAPVKPEYDEVSASESRASTGVYRIAIDNKHAAVTGEALAGAVFHIFEGQKRVGVITTDQAGTGSCSWNVEGYGFASVTKTYCSNFDLLSADIQAAVQVYTSREAAYEAAQAEASALAQAQADEAARAEKTVQIKEVTVPGGFRLTAQSTQKVTLFGGQTRQIQVANNPWQATFFLDKADRITGRQLTRDAVFALYEWNGSGYSPSAHYRVLRLPDGTYTVQADYAGAQQGILYYTQENQGRFCLKEISAPSGYIKDPAISYFQMTADGQTWNVTNRDSFDDAVEEKFYNEHQHGTVTLYKYDNEAEGSHQDGSRITQGSAATLNGAVYGLYAAEDIFCPDQSDTILHRRDQLVATAVIGRSAAADEQGYLLDADGQRCLVSGKEPKLLDTPGQTSFQQIELGRYYISEITPPDGYLPDTTSHRGEELTRYPVTFTSQSDTEAVLLRQETAKDDANLLVLDDRINTHDIYSGDFVKKQAAQFIKLDNTAGDSEKLPLCAGFSLYRIDTLSGVQDHTIVPDGSAWTKDDMEKFLNYDFHAESTALLYKRSTEAWTEADRQWLAATGSRENEYRVKEMFSDENGYFCTPELPIGQYILIETTVPEGKQRATPLLVTITKDSAVPQAVRYIGNDALEMYVRIQKTNQDSLNPDFNVVLKPGVQYRLRLLSPLSEFDSRTWHVDKDGFLWYYNPTLNVKYGTAEAPFTVKCLYENGAVVDAYIEFDQQLPFGEYELTEVTAPEGFVLSGREQILVNADARTKAPFRLIDDGAAKTTFTIDSRLFDTSQRAQEQENVFFDEYGRLIVTVEQANKEQKGIVTITKYGEQLYQAQPDFDYRLAPVAGAVFHIYAAEDIYTQQLDRNLLPLYADDLSHYLVWRQGDLVGTITTDETGTGWLGDLYLGKYTIAEVTAGEGFVLNSRQDSFEITAADSAQNYILYDSSYVNERQKVQISAVKLDAETQKPLAGAVFGLYTAEDIVCHIRYDEANDCYTADPQGHRLVTADTLVATAVSSEDGLAAFDQDLPLGKYYVKELDAPDGYVSGSATERIDIDASYSGQDTAVLVFDDLIFQNQRTRHLFVKSDFTSGAPLSGALLEIREVALDENGRPVRDAEGNYVSSLVERWISDKDETHYFYEESGLLTELGSPDELPEGYELIVMNGHLVEKLQPGRSYLFREQTAPWGYVGYRWSSEEVRQASQEENTLSEEILFTVSDDTQIFEHNMKNQRTCGTLSITKEGEFIVAAEKSFLEKTGDFFKTVFHSLFGRIEEVCFEVRVRDDICTPDQTDTIATYYNGTEQVSLVKDALVAVIATDSDGIATLKNLPLGSYYITEASVGNDAFLLNPTIAEVTLQYPGQEIPVVVHDGTTYQNIRQRVSLSVTKRADLEKIALIAENSKDVEESIAATQADGKVARSVSTAQDDGRITKSFPMIQPDGNMAGCLTAVQANDNMARNFTAPALPGTVFGLYNSQDMTGFSVSEATGDITQADNSLLPADTLLEKAVTLEDGSVTFLSDLPCGQYYIRELQAPKGYLLSEKTYEFTASYTGPDGPGVIELSCDFYDKPLIVPFCKQDIANGAELPGAAIAVTDENGTVVDEWISDTTIHHIQNLELGKSYTLTETCPAPGYTTAKAIRFSLEQARDEQGRLLQSVIIQTEAHNLQDGVITMKDDFTKLSVSKIDSASGAALSGAHLALLDAAGNIWDRWISTDEPYYLEKIPVGEYVLVEETAPQGYQKASPIPFSVQDTAELQSITMEDEKIPVSPSEPLQAPPENRPGEGGGDTGDSLRILVGLCSVLTGAAGWFLVQKKNRGGQAHV